MLLSCGANAAWATATRRFGTNDAVRSRSGAAGRLAVKTVDRLLTTEDCAQPARAAAPRTMAASLTAPGTRTDKINDVSRRIWLALRSTHETPAELMDVISYPQPEPPAQGECDPPLRRNPIRADPWRGGGRSRDFIRV